MKYGPVICDPTSKEAEALIGKTVIASNIFTDITVPKESVKSTLLEIVDGDIHPFKMGESNPFYEYTFIREVIEESPKYRPYKDCDEMIDDYCERFGIIKTDFAIPMIWVKSCRSRSVMLLTEFTGEYVSIKGVSSREMPALFNDYTYLDGSPVGKEIEE